MSEKVPNAIESLQIPTNLNYDCYDKHASQAEAALTSLKDEITSAADLDDSVLVQLASYTDPVSPWTTPAAAFNSRALLSSLPSARTNHLIVDIILQRHLRPIFSLTSPKITGSGRPSQYPEQYGAAQRGWEAPAWKKTGLTAIPTFAWAVEASDSDLIKSNWPLFTPVLLTLLEDRETPIRRTGLNILLAFLLKCPSSVLSNTGIGTVFHEAVFPTLLYLPSLTPEAESITLLRPAYTTLLVLAEVDGNPRSTSRRKQLDKLLRDGVLAAYHHASEYIHIVEVLLDVTSDIVAALGIYSAKHLHGIMSMISSVMTDPFATAHGLAILAACKALNTCFRECWPRMTQERSDEVMRIIIVCWLHVHGTGTGPKLADDLAHAIDTELKLTSKMLNAIHQDQNIPMPRELLEIIQREHRLAAIFPFAALASS